jgi:hypothetical protein
LFGGVPTGADGSTRNMVDVFLAINPLAYRAPNNRCNHYCSAEKPAARQARRLLEFGSSIALMN